MESIGTIIKEHFRLLEEESPGTLTSDGKSPPLIPSSDVANRDSFEVVAFILWYLFLVVCCVIPTGCAYRRRRIAQLEAEGEHQRNLSILSHLSRQEMDPVKARTERTKRISEALEETTFVVVESDISQNSYENQSSIHADEELGTVLDHQIIDQTLLTLPSEKPNGGRTVPGSCAICLEMYESSNRVAWSKEKSCKHAFHSECIIPWLAKKEETKCPCCRQDFCSIQPVTLSDLTVMAPFELIPASLRMRLGTAQNDEEILLTPDLASSQIATENRVNAMIGITTDARVSLPFEQEQSVDERVAISILPNGTSRNENAPESVQQNDLSAP